MSTKDVPHFLLPHALRAPQAPLKIGSVLGESSLGDEVFQHVRVLRMRDGDQVVFIDGTGGLWATRLIDAKKLSFEIIAHATQPALAPKMRLILSPPLGDALQQSIQQATEIGFARISFVRSERNQYPAKKELSWDRLQRIADQSCGQCTRAWRCEIDTHWTSLEEVFEESAPGSLSGSLIVADENLSQTGQIGFENGLPDWTREISLLIGPEGGWTPLERQVFDTGSVRLGLGQLVLRVPTAVAASGLFLRLVYSHATNR